MMLFSLVYLYIALVQKKHSRAVTNVDKMIFVALGIFSVIGIYYLASGMSTVF
ncbi:hypothetical protein KFX46_03820 [Macrococcus canis]|uniref:hypothetical protein n=1 Tax=Macrococcoides canis TaxID=1855823 RepID=UPI00207C3CFE|nr:hypothetical protein [Macrococcus canis]MCO4096129.1 hypothetical protein [Macrococcus canis]